MTYNKNCDILYLYDAKLCNPNGDPDDENKPRMDYETSRNLVSDVRLKRYIRDYLQDKGHSIFVSKVDDKSVTATGRLEKLFKDYNKKVKLTNLGKEEVDWILGQLIDVRMFGATMPIKGEENKGGASSTFTGPIQFNWGYSLNKVSLVSSNTITTHFASEAKNVQGAMGKDYRLYYSLIAFHGVISKARAKKTNLSDEDVKLLDKSLLKAIPVEATTRSKVGQSPRLLIRVEYKEDEFLGDLRRYVSIVPKIKEELIRDISDFELDVEPLINFLDKHKGIIKKVYYFQSEELKLKGEKTLKGILQGFSIEEVK